MNNLSHPENRGCTSLTSNDSIASIARWFTRVKPNPTVSDINTQMGVHFEEVAEMCQVLQGNDQESEQLLRNAQQSLEALGDHLKRSESAVRVPGADRAEFLDAICDQIVTAVGSAHFLGMDVTAGVFEVERSNYSKFDPATGAPSFDSNGKLMKGESFSPPNLELFV